MRDWKMADLKEKLIVIAVIVGILALQALLTSLGSGGHEAGVDLIGRYGD